MKIFYSWQSDKHIPNNVNRSFIEKALENAAKAIRKDESMEVVPVIDRDTVGISGTPSIPQTILHKIDESDVFVCDITIVNSSRKYRPTPNPNVLFELGYAVHKLGWEKIVMIMNEAFGTIEKLPFDLEKRRTIIYNLNESEIDKASVRKILEQKIKSALQSIAGNNEGSSFTLEKTKHLSEGQILIPHFEIYKEVQSGNQNEQYKLRIKVKNEGNKPIRDYRFETFFPNSFLNQSTMHAAEVTERRTQTHRFYRTTPTDRRNIVLYPQDELSAFSIDYFVNNQLRNSDLNKQVVKFQIFVEDNLVWTLEKEMSELTNNDVNELQRKLNEEIEESR